MVDPVTWGGMAIGSSLLGGAASTAGSLMSGYSKAQMYQYQGGVASINAVLNKQNADYARASGEVEASQYGIKARQTAGSIVAKQGASNFAVNSGSAKDVQDSQHTVAVEDQRMIRTNAARKAYGYDVEAAKSEAEASMYNSAASQAKTAGWIGAASSFLSTVSSVSSKWLQGTSVGLWGDTSGKFATNGFDFDKWSMANNYYRA